MVRAEFVLVWQRINNTITGYELEKPSGATFAQPTISGDRHDCSIGRGITSVGQARICPHADPEKSPTKLRVEPIRPLNRQPDEPNETGLNGLTGVVVEQ